MPSNHKLAGRGSVTVSGTASMDLRSSLTGQFLMAAASQATASVSIERKRPSEVSGDEQTIHRGFVIGAIMQATAALECEIWEVMTYGPGHHLGSNGTDMEARDFLAPAAEMIDGESVLERYRLVLHLLEKPPLDRSRSPWQDAALVVRLRNELVHYKSRWQSQMDGSKLFSALRAKGHPRPPFISPGSSFFPYCCLSGSCASWAVQSCLDFLDAFYAHLGFPSRLRPFQRVLRAEIATRTI